jgi:hypothetical protein
MDWNTFLVGSRIDPEDVFADACRSSATRTSKRLMNWYPLAVKELPLHLARLVCQRTNLWYDSALRKRYRRVLLTGCVVLIAGGMGVSLAIDHTMTTVRPLDAGSDDAGDHLGAQGMQPAGRDH